MGRDGGEGRGLGDEEGGGLRGGNKEGRREGDVGGGGRLFFLSFPFAGGFWREGGVVRGEK